MNLLILLLTVCVTSAVFGRSVEEEFWEDDVDPPTIEERQTEDQFALSSTIHGAVTHSATGDYRSLQTEHSDDTVFAKSFIDKIVGGTEARHGEIPWQADVKINARGYVVHHCGAVIIDTFWLLSAAHCFTLDASWYVVTVGEYHLHSNDEGQQTFKVDYIYNHQYYNRDTMENDIALIRLKPQSDGSGIIFNLFVQRVRLPDATTSLRVGTPLLVSGWGKTQKCNDLEHEPNANPVVLMKAEVRLIGQTTCKRLYNHDAITDTMFCAGYVEGGPDAYHGDSGGPLVYRAAGSNVLVGIVSWGGGCAQPKTPTVYTRVAAFLDWIHNIVQYSM